MAKRILIATHTTLAEGFCKATDFFTGMGPEILTICAYEKSQEPPKKEIEEFFETTAENDCVVVFTDLAGGSVNQIMMEELRKRRFHLITDPNLSAIMAIATLPEEEINEQTIQENLALGREQMKYLSNLTFSESTDESDFF